MKKGEILSVSYKIGFYIISMLPLYVIVMILAWNVPICWPWEEWKFVGEKIYKDKHILIPVTCGSMIVVSIIYYVIFRYIATGSKLGPVKINSIENVNYDMMSFVSSFFLPIVSFNLYDSWRHAFVLALLFVLLGRIYIRSNKYYANPTLLLLGFNMYSVRSIEIDNGKTKKHDVVLITFDTLTVSCMYRYIKIDDNTYYARKY